MPVFRDSVSDTTATTGTGTLTLAGVTAEAGTRTISSAHSNAQQLYYRVETSDKTSWEVGLGTYTSSGTTLSRDTILASSNSGSAVNFGAGTKNIYTVLPATYIEGARGTITADDPFVFSQTWNNAGVTFTALRVNVTNTASASASLLMDLQVGGSTQFAVNRSGQAQGTRFGSGNGVGPGISFNGNDLRILDGSNPSNGGALLSNGGGLAVRGDYWIGFANGGGVETGVFDIRLNRDAADTLAQRRTTNAQTFRIYNTFTDASNYERLTLRWSTNIAEIMPEAAGTGTLRQLRMGATSSDTYVRGGRVVTQISGSNYVDVNTTRIQTIIPLRFHASDPFATATAGLELVTGNILRFSDGSTGGGVIEMQEVTAPSAPATNNVRIYAEDNGSGKTRLMALFPTGSAVQIAIEP